MLTVVDWLCILQGLYLTVVDWLRILHGVYQTVVDLLRILQGLLHFVKNCTKVSAQSSAFPLCCQTHYLEYKREGSR